MLLEAENEAFIIGHPWGRDQERVSFVTAQECHSHTAAQTCLKGHRVTTRGNDRITAILFINIPIENNKPFSGVRSQTSVAKESKTTNPDSRIQAGCLMRADNTTLATRSLYRVSKISRDEPRDATRGVGTFPRHQPETRRAPAPTSRPSARPCPLPSAPLLLLLQKRQLPLGRGAESGGLAQPPVAAPVPC